MKMQTQHFTSCIIVIFFFFLIRTKQQELQKEQPLS